MVLKALVDSSILTALGRSSFIGLRKKVCLQGSIRLLLVVLSHFKEEGRKHYMFNYLSKSLRLLSKYLASEGVLDNSNRISESRVRPDKFSSFNCNRLIELLFDKRLEYGKGTILLDYVLLPLLRNSSITDLELFYTSPAFSKDVTNQQNGIPLICFLVDVLDSFASIHKSSSSLKRFNHSKEEQFPHICAYDLLGILYKRLPVTKLRGLVNTCYVRREASTLGSRNHTQTVCLATPAAAPQLPSSTR